VNALPLEIPEEEVPIPLGRSRHLPRISESASTLARMYGRGPLPLKIGGESWRFQLLCWTEPLTGARLRVRIGDTEAVVGIESLSAFGGAVEIETAIPTVLHAAYLNGLGAPVWREFEALTQRAIEVLEVRLDEPLIPDPECLGFEVGRDPQGAATRGLLRFVDPDARRNAELRRVLTATSVRKMPELPIPSGLSLRWVAEVGRTEVTAADVRSLEEHDIVLLDEVKPTPAGLNCRLSVGPARCRAGRVLLRKGGQLQMIEFGRTGDSAMSSETQTPAQPEAGFDDIPVSLRFEVAQWNASLAEVGQLAPGSVLDLGQRVDEQAVSVWVEQRCIGTGQLVAIGERLGVRLLSVFAREHA
jgi:type III secretion protein Q